MDNNLSNYLKELTENLKQKDASKITPEDRATILASYDDIVGKVRERLLEDDTDILSDGFAQNLDEYMAVISDKMHATVPKTSLIDVSTAFDVIMGEAEKAEVSIVKDDQKSMLLYALKESDPDRRCRDIPVNVLIDYNIDFDEGIVTSNYLDSMDRTIFLAACHCFVNGQKFIYPSLIYQVITGKRRVTEEFVNAYNSSIRKLKNTDISISEGCDASSAPPTQNAITINQKNRILFFETSEKMLNIRHTKAIVDGVSIEVDWIMWKPYAYEYMQLHNKLVVVPPEIYTSAKVSNTPDTISMRNALIRTIQEAAVNGSYEAEILIDVFLSKYNTSDRKANSSNNAKGRKIDKMLRFLSAFKDAGYIGGYETIAGGKHNSITAIKIAIISASNLLSNRWQH